MASHAGILRIRTGHEMDQTALYAKSRAFLDSPEIKRNFLFLS